MSGFKILGAIPGALATTEQDSAVFTASATSASVLFTVDMTNWRSVLLQVTSAGSSCTVIYEISNDQATWQSVTGIKDDAFSNSSVIVQTSTTQTLLHFPKRKKYFRARVSVYGSGTVSVAYSLSLSDVHPLLGACVWGAAGEGAAVSTHNPVLIGLECRTIRKTTVANGQVVRPIGTVDGKLIVRNHSIPENEWSYAAATGGIVNTTTPVTIAAAVATLSVYITSMQIRAQALGNATEIVLANGAAVPYWRSEIGTAGLPLTEIVFEDPIKVTANSSLTFTTLTASGTGAVYVNAQGYYAP